MPENESFQIFRSLVQFFLTIGQNNFGNKIPYLYFNRKKYQRPNVPCKISKQFFITFEIILELENVQQHDVKDEAKEKHFKPELLDLEEAPLGRKGKPNPINGLFLKVV